MCSKIYAFCKEIMQFITARSIVTGQTICFRSELYFVFSSRRKFKDVLWYEYERNIY